MEMFGIIFSIPVAYVASMVYCALLAHKIARYERLTRLLYIASVIVLVGFLSEAVLLRTLGTIRCREVIGPAFYVANSVFFFLGTPALANILLLRKRGPVIKWYVAGILCTVFAFFLVLMQYDVSEALYGIDRINGPYS